MGAPNNVVRFRDARRDRIGGHIAIARSLLVELRELRHDHHARPDCRHERPQDAGTVCVECCPICGPAKRHREATADR